MYGGEFIKTFLDNVRVPAESLVGKLNGGWEVLTGSLGTERGIVAAAIIAKLMRSCDIVCESMSGPAAKPRPALQRRSYQQARSGQPCREAASLISKPAI